MNSNFQIQLSWDDPDTGERREPRLSLPIALGREFARMPTDIQGQRVSRIQLQNEQISRFHALINLEQNQVVIIDQNSANGLSINGIQQTRAVLNNGDSLQIGSYIITFTFTPITPTAAPSGNVAVTQPPNFATSPSTSSTIQFNPTTNLPDPTLPSAPAVTPLVHISVS